MTEALPFFYKFLLEPSPLGQHQRNPLDYITNFATQQDRTPDTTLGVTQLLAPK